MNKEQLISEMLLLPAAAMDYHISQHLLELFSGKAMIESEGYLNVEGYAQAQYCTLKRQTFSYNQMNTYWLGPEPQILRPHHVVMHMGGVMLDGMSQIQGSLAPTAQNPASETQDAISKAWFEVQWQGNVLDMLVLHIQGEGFQKSHFWLLADTEEI